MKNYTYPLLFVIISFGFFSLHSCCIGKKKCDQGNFEIQFYSFNQNEIDTVIVYKYDKGNNFTHSIDSSYAFPVKYSGYDYFTTDLPTIVSDNEYKISVPGAGLTYSLQNLTTEKKACNACIPHYNKHDYYIVIKDYQLNGSTSSDIIIKAYK